MSASPLTAQATARQRTAADPHVSAWVTANAGTGKTKVLTDRVLRLLLAGTLPNRILCITFTRAAAAEMRKRVAKDLSVWATLDDATLDREIEELTGEAAEPELLDRARRLFATVLDDAVGLRIDTIHAFCQEVLKRFPLEAGVAPHFDVLDDRDAADLLDQARREVLARAQADGAGRDPALASAVETLSIEIADYVFDEVMTALTGARHRLSAALGESEGWAAALRRTLTLTTDQTATGLTASFVAPDDARDAGLAEAAAALMAGTNAEQERGRALRRWLDADADRRAALLPAFERVFLTTQGERRKTFANKSTVTAHPWTEARLGDEADRLETYKETLRPVRLFELNEAVLGLAEAVIDRFDALKGARAALDYADLIERVRRLLRSGQATWVQYKLDEGIEHLLVDEAQDTSPDQWQLVQSITDEFFQGMDAHEDMGLDRSVFVVGDPKQSIFSFQGADARVFGDVRDAYRAKVTDADRGWEDVTLEESFRSTQAVLDIVDDVFADDETSAGVRRPGETLQHRAVRDRQLGRVEVWPLAPAAETADEDAWALPEITEETLPANLALAQEIARQIKGWIENRDRIVWERPALGDPYLRPARPSDVMILVRRRNELVDMIVKELKRHNVAVAGVDRMHLGEQISVMDLTVLGDFLLLPSDNLALATVLRSPLIGLGEDQLFDLAYDRKANLWQRLGKSDDPACRVAWEKLSAWLDQVDYLTPFDFFARVLDSARDDPAASGRRDIRSRLGGEADDPVDEFLALAETYEATRTPSMQDFLHWIRSGDTVIKRDLDQGDRDEVRIMTVHGAKGLQAPIVIIPDTVSVPRDSDRILWGDEGDIPLWAPLRAYETEVMAMRRAAAEGLRVEEYRRLLYVALTRAEDRLIVCGAAPRAKLDPRCWYEQIVAGISAKGRKQEMAFPGWSGDGWVYETGDPTYTETTAPDGQSPEEVTELLGVPAPEDEPPRPLTPSRAVAEEPPVSPPLAEDGSSRFRRGLVIHRLLQSLPDLPPGEWEEATARYLARPATGIAPAEGVDIAAEVLALLRNPEFAPLFGPGSRAEAPLTGQIGAHVVSGQIDRLVVTDGSVSIVDYKTNRPPPTDEANVAPLYAAQMALYRALLQQIYPDRDVNCYLLWTAKPRIMKLSNDLLEAHLPTAGVVDRAGTAT